jgi:hypothetical protein
MTTPTTPPPNDPIPDPEPISPSLDQPDPGVFHHTPANPSKPTHPHTSSQPHATETKPQ